MIQLSTGVWTADNTWVLVDVAVSFEVADPALLNRTIGDPEKAVENTVVLALRNAIGVRPLGRARSAADDLNRDLPAVLNGRTADFGVRVTAFRVTSIAPSEPPPPDADFLDFLREPAFSVVLRGYDRARVDDLLDRARQALAGNRPDRRATVADELGQSIPVRLRGYDRAQVDNLRRLLTAALTVRPA